MRDMEMRLLTPTEIWEGFNPVKDGTETSIFSSCQNDNLVTVGVFFTSEKTESGRVRVFARVYYDARWRDARPAVLLLPSHDRNRNFDDITSSLVSEGYVVCLCDYAGAHDGDEPHTTYPDEFSYAAAPQCMSNLYTVKTTARETPWFQWAKVARRAITMLGELKYVDAERIGVMGVDIGAQIAWQVAGIDGRVRALVPINGGGYLWRRGTPRFSAEGKDLPVDDEERAFSAGVGAETYARFVSCPTYYIVSSNSRDADIDRAGDIMSLVPAKSKVMVVVRGSASQVSLTAYASLIKWLQGNFAHDTPPFGMPEAKLIADENEVYLRLNCHSEPESVSAFYSRGEEVSFARNWTALADAQNVGENEFVFRIPSGDPSQLVVAYATIKTSDGICASTPVSGIVPAEHGVTAVANVAAGNSRIVYSGDMGAGLFWVTTDGFFLDDSVLAVRKGPFDIRGIGTTKGTLVLCRSTHEFFSCEKGAVLQMDIYSDTRRDIDFRFVAYPDLTEYSCKVTATGGDFWQKIKISAAELKSDEGKPLPRFGMCKLLLISDAENVLFNNIVWI